jgi:hyperosmotically inducible protein
MLKRMSVVICGLAFTLMTAGYVSAQTATQEAKDKTKAAAQKTATVMTDAEITAAVKTKLLADSKVGGLKIDVDTDHGVVTLSGPVHSGTERAQALRLARNTGGVKSVKNKLVMETAGTTGKNEPKDSIKDDTKQKAGQVKEAVTDASITAAVKTKLLADTQVGGLKIDVDTKDNVVTLTGEVRSAAEKAEAIRLAKTTTGVKSVVDKLTIK